MGTIHYEKRIVAFIDILGFKSLIEETQKPDCMPEKVENIRDAFSYIYNMLEEHYTKEQVQEINYSTFSDCIVFSFPIRQNDSLFFSLLPLVWLQAELMWKHDMLLRGAITVGDIYHDDKMVFGPAMVEAHELEGKKAIYPRIILDNKIEEEYSQWLAELQAEGDSDKLYNLKNELTYTFKRKSGLLTKDEDGYYYVNYLEKIVKEMDQPENYKKFITHAESLTHQYLKPNMETSVLKKYVWLHEKLQKIKLKF